MPKKTQIAIGKRGGRIAGYHVVDGKLKAYYVDDTPESSSASSIPEKKEPTIIHGIRIPPAYSVVWESPTAEGDENGLLVIALDQKGRKQYVYNQAHWDKVNAEKWARVRALVDAMPSIRDGIRRGLTSGDDTERQSFEVLAVIEATGMRIGSERETFGKVKAYGASTLLVKHLTLTKKSATFKFIGKEGIPNEFTVDDPIILACLRRRLKDVSAYPEVPIWPGASDAKVRKALKAVSPQGLDFKVKDLRALKGTMKAVELVQNSPPPPQPRTKAEFEKARKFVATACSKILGNTPKVCLDSYIPEFVFDPWKLEVA